MTSLPQTLDALRDALATRDERILQLEAVLAPHEDFAKVGHFSPQEATVLSVILKWETASHDQILQALYSARYGSDAPSDGILKVRLHYVRRSLTPHGITIQNAYGVGYRMPPADKSRLRALMAGPALDEGTP